jgi:hypothetical protein
MKRIIAFLLLLSLAAFARAADKLPYQVTGLYTETCACSAPCKCELTGDVPPSCEGFGAFKITAGSYGGADLSGVSIAYATKPGAWVRTYIDAPDKAHRVTAEKLARAIYAGFGPMEAVKDAKVVIVGANGAYTVNVDGGKVMTYITEPLIGGDGKTALTLGNTHNALTPVFFQGLSAAPASYHDGDRSIDLDKGRNAYFNETMQNSGEI